MTHVQWQTSGKLSGKPVANSVANPVANLRAVGERFWHAPRKIIVVLIIRYSIETCEGKAFPHGPEVCHWVCH